MCNALQNCYGTVMDLLIKQKLVGSKIIVKFNYCYDNHELPVTVNNSEYS